MRIRGYDREAEDIKLAMTPMIDIVFQLLVFFIMTYNPVAMEGDYNIKMPLAAKQPQLDEKPLEDVLVVKLNADGSRNLASIEVQFGPETKTYARDANNPQAMFESLRGFVIGALAGGSEDPSAASEVEAEIDTQYDLRYEETVHAIEAVSGYKTDDGQIVKLIEKIKFRDNQ